MSCRWSLATGHWEKAPRTKIGIWICSMENSGVGGAIRNLANTVSCITDILGIVARPPGRSVIIGGGTLGSPCHQKLSTTRTRSPT